LIQTTAIARPTPTLPPPQITHAEVTSLSSVPSQTSQHRPLDTPNLIMHGHTDQVTCVTFSPDGKYVISGSEDLTIRIWDAQTGDLTLPPLKSHTNCILCLGFSLDGR